jgi:hypothetical protein
VTRPLRRLTPAQFRVVAVLWHEDTTDYAYIGAKLDLSPRTVRKHVEDAADWLPGGGPPVWKVFRYAERLLALGFTEDDGESKGAA